MLDYLIAVCASFIQIGLIGVQTRVIILNNIKLVFIISFGITASSYMAYRIAAHQELWYFLASSGLGGSLGMVVSIWKREWIVKLSEYVSPGDKR